MTVLLLPGVGKLLFLPFALLFLHDERMVFPAYGSPLWSVNGKLVRGKLSQHVVIEESLLMGTPTYTAEAALPLVSVPQEQFRTNQNALLLSIAAAVTAPYLRSLPDEALVSLGIRPENIRRQYPVLRETHMGEAVSEPYPGVIVQDGKHQRAYFASVDSGMAACCQKLFDRTERMMTQGDLAQIAQQAGIHFATALVVDGNMEAPVYLGRLRPITQPHADATILASIQTLTEQGYVIHYSGTGDYVSVTNLPITPYYENQGLYIRRLVSDGFSLEKALASYQQYHQAKTKRLWQSVLSLMAALLIAFLCGLFVSSLHVGFSWVLVGFELCAFAISLLPVIWFFRFLCEDSQDWTNCS